MSGGTGTLYQITPAGKVTVLHTFIRDGDGLFPGTLIAGNDGSYYGTTYGSYPVDDDPFDTAIPATLFRVTLTRAPLRRTSGFMSFAEPKSG